MHPPQVSAQEFAVQAYAKPLTVKANSFITVSLEFVVTDTTLRRLEEKKSERGLLTNNDIDLAVNERVD
jgi:hypothetical protein